jgi:dipeptidyl aminopeptidase/acylaminoacyl peptidase
MWSAASFLLCIAVMPISLNSIVAIAQSPDVSPRDCVEVQYITGVWMNLAGTQVAYLVKTPNIAKNINEFQLYVKDISDTTASNGKLLTAGAEMSDIQWTDNDRHIALLVSIGGVKKLVSVDTKTGISELVFPTEESIDSFSMDAAGDTVAYSIPDPINQEQGGLGSTPDELADGYRINLENRESDVNDGWQTMSIYLRRRDAQGVWSPPQAINIENPFTHAKTTHAAYPQYLSVSPDGRKVALSYVTDGVPDDWSKNPYVRLVRGAGLRSLPLPVLFDVDSGKTTLAFKMIVIYSRPAWSSDSQSFFLNAHSPVGSRWEVDDIRDGQTSETDINMFEVNVATGTVEEVLRGVPRIAYHGGPLFLLPDGGVVVRTAGTAIARLQPFNGGWKETGRIVLPQRSGDRFEKLASNGREIWGVHETVTSPENLFTYRSGQPQISLITNLNTRFSALRPAPVEDIHWITGEGLNVSGLLFMPPDYIPGRRYPLVIQTKGDSGWFTCDSGPNHDPSFAPQPIASSGMMYLARSFDENWNMQQEIEKRPTGYPGGISEAVQQMDIWDSAVDELDRRGLIDPNKVGIIGFSRTGWYVEFALVHSRVHFAAATVTDNVQYSLSDYWLIPSFGSKGDQMYGGPPFGETLMNWRKYSISFNLEAIHTPLLMEEMGYGIHDDRRYSIPVNLAVRYEITKGLASLGKPVEMYYYPNEDHQLDHPRARQATMQRNLDWYRFWLLGYEEPDPSKKEQYRRWEALKGLQQQDAASRPQGTEPSQQ